MATRPNNASIVETCTRRVRALRGYVDARATIAINGRKHAHAEVVGIYRRNLDARAKVANLRAQLQEAIQAVEELEGERLEADRALKAWVRGEFGVESTEAIDFGFPPPKKAVRSVEEKARAVERGRATREARHTMGRRQKEGIRGAVAAPRVAEARGVAVAAATVTVAQGAAGGLLSAGERSWPAMGP